MTPSVGAPADIAALVCEGSGLTQDESVEGSTVAFAREPEPDSGAEVVWLDRARATAGLSRVIAPDGERLWRRAPWPAADALFELPPGAGGVLVVGGDPAGPLREALRARGVDVAFADVLDRGGLAAARCVAIPGGPGALPAEAPAVLAAGRVLVTTPCKPDFGFRPAIDHCVGTTTDDLADLAESVVRHWDAFHGMRIHARIAAERHRASRVLADLMADLELGL